VLALGPFAADVSAQNDQAVPIQLALKAVQKERNGRIGLELKSGAQVFGKIVERGATFVVLDQYQPRRRIRVEHDVITGFLDPDTGSLVAVDNRPPMAKKWKMGR
jgi:hypothetical protein